jgi:hypothetical protein
LEYEEVSEAGTLRIDYHGRSLDTHSIAVIHLNLQEIYDKVAWGTLADKFRWPDIPFYFGWRHPHYRYYRWLPDQRLVRAEIRELQTGSLVETVVLLIPAVLADPNVRAVLQNLAANIIYEIGATRLRGVRKDDQKSAPRSQSRIPPMFDVRSNVREIVQAIAENGGGKLRFTHKSPEGEISTVEVEVPSDVRDE